ncbi:putative ubiquitinyl hydrolase 1 [Helianthus annuus]|nr:putative ubiquitinyl hydrolase 1 [Helianthus annuus]
MLWSDVFFVGGCKWRVLIYPKGNNTDHLSLYLDAADSITLPYGWNRHAQFSLAMVNQIHSESTIRKDAEHHFNAQESDWGFTSFMPLSDLYDPRRGYLLNDTCIVEVDVAVMELEEDEILAPHSEFAAAEGSQSVEENANAVDAPIADDPPSVRFTWIIENFSKLTGKKLYSNVFFVGGYKWRVLIFPKGNNGDYLSVYLDVADSTTSPHGWSRNALFSLAVVNQIHSEFTISKDTEHEFNARESDWGFTSFMPLSDLYDPRRGYLLNDTCIVEADVVVLELEEEEMSVPHFEFAAGEGSQPVEENANAVDAPIVDDPPSLEEDEILAPHSEFAAAEGSQSVEENANAVDAPIADDPPSVRFTWTIENFSKLTGKKLYSNVFFVGGYKWRVLIFPKGNNGDCLSVYLDVADSTTSPHGWSRNALFSLAVVNQIHSEFTISKDTEHEFNARESDWGFTSFMPLSDLYDPRRGYLLNDTCIVEADVVVLELEEEEMSVPHFEFAAGEGSQPVEENANAVDAPIVDPPSVRFTWKIENFSKLTRKKLYSRIFFVGGYKWRVLMYPKGNNTDHLSMYLDVADSTTSPHGWSRKALFSLAVVNQIHSEFTLSKETEHQFNALKSDWGFTSFMPLSDLYDPHRGYLLNDTCIVEADVAVLEVVDVKSSMPNLDSLSING